MEFMLNSLFEIIRKWDLESIWEYNVREPLSSRIGKTVEKEMLEIGVGIGKWVFTPFVPVSPS